MELFSTLSNKWATLLVYPTFIGAFTLVLRKWIAGGKCKSKARLDGKTVVITGGNTGIGKETAMILASRGASVVIACRDTRKGEHAASEIRSQVPGAEVEVYPLNLASFASIRRFAKEITAAKPHIHILINNAGIGFCPEGRTEDGYELQFGVNHLGHFLLTNLLLKNIKASVPARIIVLASKVHEMGTINFDNINLEGEYGKYKAYFQSKLANVLFSRELARRLHGTGVSVYCLHPGVVNSELLRHTTPYNWLLACFLNALYGFFMKTVEQGAQTTVYCAVDESIQAQSGYYYSDCKRKQAAPHALDDLAAHKLWELSQKLVDL